MVVDDMLRRSASFGIESVIYVIHDITNVSTRYHLNLVLMSHGKQTGPLTFTKSTSFSNVIYAYFKIQVGNTETLCLASFGVEAIFARQYKFVNK